MVAPAFGVVNLRRSAELAPNDDRNVLIHSAHVQVFDQTGQGVVQFRQALAALLEVGVVIVPTAERQGHATRTGLDQSASHEKMVHAARGTVVDRLHVAHPVAGAKFGVFLAHVQGVDQPAGGEDFKRLASERVHPLDRAVGVEFALKAVEALEQQLAVAEPRGVDRLERHVFQVGTVRAERRVRKADISRLAGISPRRVRGSRRKADERRHRRIDRSFQPRQNGADARPTPLLATFEFGITGRALHRRVLAPSADHRADDRILVGHLRQARHMFANFDAGHIGRDRLELAAHFRRSVGLEVEHVLVRRPAGEEHHNDRFMRLRFAPRSRLGGENLGKGHSSHRQAADFQEIASSDAVAISVSSLALDGEHRSVPFRT